MGHTFTQDARERFERTWARLMEGREKKPATMKDVEWQRAANTGDTLAKP